MFELILQLVLQLVFAFVFYIVPIGLILRKSGRSPFIALIAFVPIIGLLFVLRELAVGPWPAKGEV
jgi:uncharacterized membrane protein YoaK (UPF0700 family)